MSFPALSMICPGLILYWLQKAPSLLTLTSAVKGLPLARLSCHLFTCSFVSIFASFVCLAALLFMVCAVFPISVDLLVTLLDLYCATDVFYPLPHTSILFR